MCTQLLLHMRNLAKVLYACIRTTLHIIVLTQGTIWYVYAWFIKNFVHDVGSINPSIMCHKYIGHLCHTYHAPIYTQFTLPLMASTEAPQECKHKSQKCNRCHTHRDNHHFFVGVVYFIMRCVAKEIHVCYFILTIMRANSTIL